MNRWWKPLYYWFSLAGSFNQRRITILYSSLVKIRFCFKQFWARSPSYMNILPQNCSNPIANTLDLLHSCAKPMIFMIYMSIKIKKHTPDICRHMRQTVSNGSLEFGLGFLISFIAAGMGHISGKAIVWAQRKVGKHGLLLLYFDIKTAVSGIEN